MRVVYKLEHVLFPSNSLYFDNIFYDYNRIMEMHIQNSNIVIFPHTKFKIANHIITFCSLWQGVEIVISDYKLQLISEDSAMYIYDMHYRDHIYCVEYHG